jgi:hypothetical protein
VLGSDAVRVTKGSIVELGPSRIVGCARHEQRLHAATLLRRGSIRDVVSEPRDRARQK